MSDKTFKVGEWVLVFNGEIGYIPRKVNAVHGDTLMIDFGAYQTEYSKNSVHKCPKTLIPKEQN